jgi:YrbI family 3-deoxy-D-manno-octulosonate 8-phosphate phosphatase
MDVLAIIPAVHPLGARSLAGRPLVLHAVEQARATRQVTRVVAATADPELKRLLADTGIDIVETSDADDDAAASLAAAMEALAGRDGFAPTLALMLDPFYPLRAPETIEGAIDLLWRCGADSLISVYALTDSLWVQDERGVARPVDRSPAQRRFVETGLVSGVRVGSFRQTGELPTGRVVLYKVTAMSALRIANGADWANAELLHRRASAARAQALLRGIELLVFDFDGVMTDNRVLVFDDGREAVLCSRGDGMGLERLRNAGVRLAVISKEINPVVGARCEKLKIPYLQGIEDKLAELMQIVRERGLELAHVAYVGNDVNDLECMHAAGVAIAPADSHPDALRAADLVTSAPGGLGAVREVCDLVLAARALPPEP